MWRKKLKMLASILVLALVFTMFVPVSEAEASSYLTQSAIYTNKIVLKINPNFYYKNYYIDDFYVDVSVNNGDYQNVIHTSPSTTDGRLPTEITLSPVSPLNDYDVKVYYKYSDKYGYSYSRSDYLYDAVVLPSKVTGLRQSNWWCYICDLRADWNQQRSAKGYQYELKNYKGAYVLSPGTTTGYSATTKFFNNLPLQVYQMRVRAYTTFNGRKQYGAWSNWIEIVPPVKSLTGKAKKKKVSLKWSKVPGATSYTIFVSTKRNSGYKATKTVSAKKNKVTIKKIGKKKLKSKKTYYIYVRPNRKVNGKDVFSTFANSSTIILYGRVR